jgi:hypothetical protein
VNFDNLFLKHGAAAYDKQIYLQAQFGKTGWGFDLNSGVLAFRPPHEQPLQLSVQVLGTESDDTHTWLWSWANDSQIPPDLITSALQLRQLGEVEHIAQFTNPELAITPQVNSACISLVASGILRASAYFRAPYPRGAMYLLIKDPKYKRSVTRPIPRVVKAFPLFLAKHHVADQRAAFMAYLKFYHLKVREEGNAVIATGPAPRSLHGEGEPDQLVAEFDARSRLVSLR